MKIHYIVNYEIFIFPLHYISHSNAIIFRHIHLHGNSLDGNFEKAEH